MLRAARQLRALTPAGGWAALGFALVLSLAGSRPGQAYAGAAPQLTGKFVVRLPTRRIDDENHRVFYRGATAILADFATKLNAQLALPRDVVLTTDDSEEANVYYSEKTHSITITYGLLVYVVAQLRDNEARGKGAAAVEGPVGILRFVLFHELGHCLINECDLPVPGREEDDADQVATLLMTSNSNQSSLRQLAAAALFFERVAGSPERASDIAWDDVHSIGKQRMYNILSWMYGSDPIRLRSFVDTNILSAERAQAGVQEFRRIRRAWDQYLKPYVKA